MDGSSLRTGRRCLAALPLPELVALFSRWISFSSFTFREPRRRLFPFELTFWLFLAQAPTPRMSCSEVVKWMIGASALCPQGAPPTSTSAYCQAPKRLPARMISAIMEQVSSALARHVKRRALWHGHRVRIVDATHVLMDDTAANRRCFGYVPGMKRGCGFPALKLLAFFSLATGGLCHYILSRNGRSSSAV